MPPIVLAESFFHTLARSPQFIGPGLLVLSLLVLLHEFGHFLVAKRLDVPVSRFSIGFGPRLIGVKIGETDYCISLFPLGGYVSMAQETKGEEGQTVVTDLFTVQRWWKRALIAVAGPAANLVAGYALMVIVGLVGVTYDDYKAEIGPLPQGSLATQVGFVRDQKVLAVNDKPVRSWKDFIDGVRAAPADAQVEVQDPTGNSRVVVLPAAAKDSILGEIPPRLESVVGSVLVGLPAYPAGLRQGDHIVAVNGKPVTYWEELTESIQDSPGKPVTLTVERGGGRFPVTLRPTPQQEGSRIVGRIGIQPPRASTFVVRMTPVEALSNAFPLLGRLIDQTGRGLWMLFTSPARARDQMGGPLLIMHMASQQAERGVADLLFFMGVISVAIMAFNLLPLPVLDGGHLLLALLEGVRRKPLAQGFLTAYQRLGLALIGSLLVFILFNDVWREAQRGRAVSRGDRAEESAPNSPR